MAHVRFRNRIGLPGPLAGRTKLKTAPPKKISARYKQKFPSCEPNYPLGVKPNLVITTQYQAAWEKLFKYMDIEARLVPTSAVDFAMNPEDLEAYFSESKGYSEVLGSFDQTIRTTLV